MEKIVLAFPEEGMESEAIAFRKEFFDHGEKEINGSYKWDMRRYSYSEWLQIIRSNLDKDKITPKFGPSHTLFAVDSGNHILGVVNFRHTLTDFYKNSGHIGYSVRPSLRRKGIATEILNQTLKLAKSVGLTEVYLVCREDNDASRKTILRNGGLLHRLIPGETGNKEEYVVRL